MASRTRWTWVWVNFGRWWWTGRPGVLWFMGSQRVGHDWATELNWTHGIQETHICLSELWRVSLSYTDGLGLLTVFWDFHIYLHEHICDCYSQQECRSKLPSLQLLKLSPKTARRRKWQPTPVLLPREFCGWQSLVGFCPWGRRELDTTEQLHFPFSLSFTGEGNGNPLQYSCLENPRDGGAWWAAIYGVALSWTRLKWLSSSSSSSIEKQSHISYILRSVRWSLYVYYIEK